MTGMDQILIPQCRDQGLVHAIDGNENSDSVRCRGLLEFF
jgi:hypothetical protein